MSLKLPTVSIIVDAYQDISYLPATLDSILQQTDGNFEILVFSDDYRQIHTWFRRQPDIRLKFTVQSNLGLANTLNRGLLEAQGKYISFIRAGDLWHPNKLEQQLFCLDRHPEVALIHSGSLLLDYQHPSRQNTALIGSCAQNRSFARATMVNPFKNLLQQPEILAQNQLNLSSVMLRRSCFEIVGLFNPQLQIIPDWEMWIRLSNHYQFMAIAEPLVYCRQRQEHQSNSLTLETDLQTTIETTYAHLSSQLEQKYRSYGFASLFLAHNTLQMKNPDLAIARNYWYQALMHNPLIIFSLEFCQLRWAIFHRHFRLYCRQQYRHLLQLIQNASRFKIAISPTRRSQDVFNWMLESEEGSN